MTMIGCAVALLSLVTWVDAGNTTKLYGCQIADELVANKELEFVSSILPENVNGGVEVVFQTNAPSLKFSVAVTSDDGAFTPALVSGRALTFADGQATTVSIAKINPPFAAGSRIGVNVSSLNPAGVPSAMVLSYTPMNTPVGSCFFGVENGTSFNHILPLPVDPTTPSPVCFSVAPPGNRDDMALWASVWSPAKVTVFWDHHHTVSSQLNMATQANGEQVIRGWPQKMQNAYGCIEPSETIASFMPFTVTVGWVRDTDGPSHAPGHSPSPSPPPAAASGSGFFGILTTVFWYAFVLVIIYFAGFTAFNYYRRTQLRARRSILRSEGTYGGEPTAATAQDIADVNEPVTVMDCVPHIETIREVAPTLGTRAMDQLRSLQGGTGRSGYAETE